MVVQSPMNNGAIDFTSIDIEKKTATPGQTEKEHRRRGSNSDQGVTTPFTPASSYCDCWITRNIVHLSLLSLAVLSLLGTAAMSVDSCSSSIENVTTTAYFQVYTEVTKNITKQVNTTTLKPLSMFLMLDASDSMSWSTEGPPFGWNTSKPLPENSFPELNCPVGSTCDNKTVSNREFTIKYIVSDGDSDGNVNDATMFSCQLNSEYMKRNALKYRDCGGKTPTAATAVSQSFNKSAMGDRFDQAKVALRTMIAATNGELNDNNASGTNVRAGIMQWATDERGVVIEQDLDTNMDTVLEVNDEMVINGGGQTCWAYSLCQCYSKIKNDPQSVNSSKLCILITDGSLTSKCLFDYPRYNGTHVNDPNKGIILGGDILHKNSSAISTDNRVCSDLYADWTAETGNTVFMSHRNISDFVKTQGFDIMGIEVRSSGYDDVYDTASCDDYENKADCPYYIALENFGELASKATEIAEYQRLVAEITTSATVTEVVNETVADTTSVESLVASDISVCDLTFLYALGAFGPFLAYILYRLFTICSERRSMMRKIRLLLKNSENISKWGVAGTTTRVLLPNKLPLDIDFIVSWLLFTCFPCLLPVSHDEFDVQLASTFAL